MAKNIAKADSLEKALKLVGKKFDLLIIDAIGSGKGRKRFNQLLKEIPSINPRTLSTRLKSLEKDGLITRSLVLGINVKTEYVLTEKAEKLAEIIQKLKEWTERA